MPQPLWRRERAQAPPKPAIQRARRSGGSSEARARRQREGAHVVVAVVVVVVVAARHAKLQKQPAVQSPWLHHSGCMQAPCRLTPGTTATAVSTQGRTAPAASNMATLAQRSDRSLAGVHSALGGQPRPAALCRGTVQATRLQRHTRLKQRRRPQRGMARPCTIMHTGQERQQQRPQRSRLDQALPRSRHQMPAALRAGGIKTEAQVESAALAAAATATTAREVQGLRVLLPQTRGHQARTRRFPLMRLQFNRFAGHCTSGGKAGGLRAA